jgi:hypothetical protein
MGAPAFFWFGSCKWFVGDVYVFFWPTALTNLQYSLGCLWIQTYYYSATVVVGPSRLWSYVLI